MILKKRKSRNVRLIIGVLVSFSLAYLGSTSAYAAESLSPKLTPKLNQLLTDEMLSIKQAVTHIMNGLIVGDHSIVENMATQINDSFILKQQLTEQDKKDLMAVAPKQFLKLDEEFHKLSEKLANAAIQKDFELQRFYFGRLIESCQGCHTEYVTDKFPGFAGVAPSGHVH